MGDSNNKIQFTEHLIAQIRKNNSATLKELYISNYPKIENFVLKNNGNKDQAKDVFQEAFIVFWKNIKEDKFTVQNNSSLHGYLYTISKNKWMDYLRSSNYKKTVNESKVIEFSTADEYLTDKDDDILKEKRLHNIMLAFKDLGEPCNSLLKMFYYEKKSLSHIATVLNVKENTIRNKKYRCMNTLRNMVLTQKKN
ncbi:hypothetical protein BWZ22_16385 [Seonamhaeicola sp. S2-3]|uniref:RNA polymerase sigma factor n=1 Tax=Seonamhaeicola sp. S2-3 TaxID=1936081 RepID=UPI000972A08C|nr:sigma-70 family RNA polymerase sigma factor [Seonamhaeicola sp. S2-3]APY12702.1 hypothetical protein BWZ22_16385 [Seonamhaeicola sp. S2-3]